jgi:predicted Rossmann fold nucleotide-binding protein DprA/Smf involved in DNA uptake
MARKRKKAARKQRLPHGKLGEIIIQAVGVSDEPVNARQLAERLDFWGFAVTPAQVAMRLAGLQAAGKIKRVKRGRYARIKTVRPKRPAARSNRRRLPHGDLTRIIIGTVCCCEAGEGINAAELTAKLNSWGHKVTKAQMATRLSELARDGVIERVSRGRYEGV